MAQLTAVGRLALLHDSNPQSACCGLGLVVRDGSEVSQTEWVPALKEPTVYHTLVKDTMKSNNNLLKSKTQEGWLRWGRMQEEASLRKGIVGWESVNVIHPDLERGILGRGKSVSESPKA